MTTPPVLPLRPLPPIPGTRWEVSARQAPGHVHAELWRKTRNGFNDTRLGWLDVIVQTAGGIILRLIWVTPAHRGDGWGSKMLDALLAAYPDQSIRLRIEAVDGSPLTDDDLFRWYAHRGFVWDAEYPGWRVRAARTPAPNEF